MLLLWARENPSVPPLTRHCGCELAMQALSKIDLRWYQQNEAMINVTDTGTRGAGNERSGPSSAQSGGLGSGGRCRCSARWAKPGRSSQTRCSKGSLMEGHWLCPIPCDPSDALPHRSSSIGHVFAASLGIWRIHIGVAGCLKLVMGSLVWLTVAGLCAGASADARALQSLPEDGAMRSLLQYALNAATQSGELQRTRAISLGLYVNHPPNMIASSNNVFHCQFPISLEPVTSHEAVCAGLWQGLQAAQRLCCTAWQLRRSCHQSMWARCAAVSCSERMPRPRCRKQLLLWHCGTPKQPVHPAT